LGLLKIDQLIRRFLVRDVNIRKSKEIDELGSSGRRRRAVALWHDVSSRHQRKWRADRPVAIGKLDVLFDLAKLRLGQTWQRLGKRDHLLKRRGDFRTNRVLLYPG